MQRDTVNLAMKCATVSGEVNKLDIDCYRKFKKVN